MVYIIRKKFGLGDVFLSSCVILDKLLYLSGPQFPHVLNEEVGRDDL